MFIRVVFSLCVTFASVQIVGAQLFGSQSAEAKAVLDFGPAFPASREVRYFCGKMVLKYSNLDAFTNEGTQARVRMFSNLEKGGYLIKDDGFSGSLMGDVTYTFTPTTKLWALADRREGDCFFFKTSPTTDIKITLEEKHPHYSRVSSVYATLVRELKQIEHVTASAWGYPTGKDRRARFVVLLDPYNQKPRVVAWDWGTPTGWWSGNKVPDALALLNVAGPDALEQLKQ